MYRHGDLLLMPMTAPDPLNICETLPATDSVTLLQGERTGHAHVLHGATVTAHALMRPYRDVAVHVQSAAELRHEEHDTIIIPPGWYRVVRQRVYTPRGPVIVRD